MSDLAGLFDSLYSRLLLRDFFGKVVRGTIIILSVCATIFSPRDILKFIYDASFFSDILFIGFAWIVAFALQALGEVTCLIKYHTSPTNEEFYVRRHEFHENTDPNEHQQLERLVVIKEACGNGYVALGLSTIFLSLHVLVADGYQAIIDKIKLHWPTILLIALLIAFLAVMHFIHVRRQDAYMNAILNATVAQDK